jgi:chitinase
VHLFKRLSMTAATALMVPVAIVAVTHHTSAAASLTAAQPHPAVAAPHATSGGAKIAYFDQWSIYQNAFYVKNLDTEGIAGKLDYLIYDFENIDPANLTCMETTKATDPDPGGETDPNAGDGAGDEWADDQKGFDASTSVNGQADTYNQTLAGNFNQLKELKAKYPKLKIIMSLGGWTYSKYFSDVAATAASRQKYVASCIDMFIKGNLPVHDGVHGGTGAGAGIFDGFDIDWEYPGGGGHTGNHASTADKANFTALLAEFRSELNAYGSANNKTMYLSAALPSGQDKISDIQTDQIGQYLDFGDVMTYDMHGAWDATGPTNFADPVYSSPSDPMTPVAPGNEKYNIDTAVTAYTTGLPDYGITGGFPASKITIGFPFYYRGWTGVPAGSNHGLFQTASGPSAGMTLSGNVPGTAMYKEISGTVGNPADTFYDPTSEAAWFYDGTNFWTGDSAQSIQAKANYLHCKGLGGAMMFSMYDLDPATTLFNDVVNDVNGSGSGTCTSPPPTSPPPTSPPPTSPPPVSPPPTSPPPVSPPPSSGVVNGGLESGTLSPWTCDAGTGSVVTSPVHSGKYALAGAASASDDAQCSEKVTVQPGHTYSLSAWVNGSYVYLGVTGSGTTDTNTWTPGTGGAYQQLKTSFTTGSATTSVTLYLHGWYGQGTYDADDVALT